MRYFRGVVSDPFRRRVIVAIISVLSVYGLTIGFFYPLISLKLEMRGISPALIGIMGALPFFASIIVSPFIPLIMRYFKVVRLVFFAIFSDLVFIVIMMLTDDLYVWFFCRFMMGVAGSIIFVVSETWINEIAEDHYRGRVLALYTLVFSGTLALSPLLIVFLGAEGNLPFLIAAIAIVFATIPLRWARDSAPDFSGGKASHVLRFVLLAPTLVAASALMAFDEAALITLLPVYALRNGLTDSTAALMLTVLALGSMAIQPIVGRLADSMNRYVLLYINAVLVLVGALLLPLIIKTDILLWVVLFLWGGAIAAIYTVALTIMGARFRGAQLAAGNAAFGLMWGVAGTIAPGAGGFGMTAWGPNGFVGVLIVSALAFLVLAAVRSMLSRR